MIETFELFAKSEWRKQTSFGIKSSEIRVLVCIRVLSTENDHGVNISDISKKLAVTSPTVTQMVKHLIHEGFVQRAADSRDKRISLLRLTDKGELVAEKAFERFKTIFYGLIETIGEKESKELITLLNQVYQYFRQLDPIDRE
ncbi:MarR family winged helix-turn-helix transcriptional regulator [Paenibacillus nasutitermitis]|nr:MarR family transcriptional regulator [Paenibacillus nasutitermitis]